MTISAISGYGRIQNIYPYHNTHFNQLANIPVTPVGKAGRVPGIAEDEERLHLGVTYGTDREQTARLESSAMAKKTEELKNVFDAGEELQYDMSNPYEASRMSLDGMLLTGMNIDVMA